MCERVCRAEGILWQGEEQDMMLLWWEARKGKISTAAVDREYGKAQMVMIPHVTITLYQEDIHCRF